jgi:uncharacterized GH25 family protein
MAITYKELAERIAKLSPEWQNAHVTVSCDASEEIIPVNYFHQIRDDDRVAGGVLDEGHPILAIDF